MVIEYRNPRQDIRETKGMRQLSGHRQGLVALCECLLRIAEIPQDKRQTAQTHQPPILAVERQMVRVLGRGVVDAPLLKVLAGRHKLTQPGESDPERIVCLHQEHWVLCALCQSQKLFTQLTRGV
jgi:hypothetical protein